MQFLFRFDAHLERFEKGAVIGLFTGIILLVFFNILTRNVLNESYQLIFEIAPAMVLWLALIGSSLALKHQRHIRIAILLRHLPGRLQQVAVLITSLFGMVVMGVLLLASLEFVQTETDLFGLMGWVSIVFPVFFSLSFLRYGLRVLVACSIRPPGQKT